MARPNFVEKIFAGGSKTVKFVKVFCYTVYPFNEETVVYKKSPDFRPCIKLSSYHVMVTIVLLCVHDYFQYAIWIINGNNRRITGMLGRIIRETFKNYRIE